jgi:hypothetical protein
MTLFWQLLAFGVFCFAVGYLTHWIIVRGKVKTLETTVPTPLAMNVLAIRDGVRELNQLEHVDPLPEDEELLRIVDEAIARGETPWKDASA